jgi:hypothetical protein
MKSLSIWADSILILLALGLELKAVAASVPDSCPISLEKGIQWVYEGKIEWTGTGLGAAKTAKIRWITQVMDVFKGTNAQAAVVRGFPVELVAYEPGQSAGFTVLLSVSNKLYCITANGGNQARDLARQYSQNPGSVPSDFEALFQWPLVIGRKLGQDPVREDTWYCWCVEQVIKRPLSVKGFDGNRSQKTYRLAYRTCPDDQFLDVVPGLGIVRFVYNHHGTVASTDVRLVSFSRPRL